MATKDLENDIYRIVIDIDGTICHKNSSEEYIDASPDIEVINKLKEYKEKGFYIILHSSRQMNTFKNNIGKINVARAKIRKLNV